MIAVPAVLPVTMPELSPTEAVPGRLLAHVPPPASLKVVVAAGHTFSVPVMVFGNAFTVNTEEVKQPVD